MLLNVETEMGIQRALSERTLRHTGHLSDLEALVHLEYGEGSNMWHAKEITSGSP